MFQHFKTTPQMAWMHTLACLALVCGRASAQDFSMRVANPNPLGIGNFVPTSLDLANEARTELGIKGSFLYGLGLQTAYDSNFFITENDKEDEITISIQPWFNYRSDPEGGAPFSFSANYSPSYSAYVNNTDLNEFSHSTNASMTWSGSVTEVSAFASYQPFSGTDRLTGEFTDGASFTGGVRATRQIAPRTSLNGSLSYSQSVYSSEDQQGTRILSSSFGLLWSATERTSLGSSIAYSQTESGSTGTRDALALLADFRYRLGERIWLSASLGPDFSKDSETGDNNLNLSADINARYAINERWSWVNSIGTGTIASPSDTGYLVNNYSFSTALEHQLLRASISGGLSFDYSVYQSVAKVQAERENEENMSLFLSYGRQLWSDRVGFNASMRYNINSGDTDWSQWVISTGLNIQF